MYGCESWTVKKAGRRRIDAFELWCWRRLLRVPWTARRSNQSILKVNQSWIFIGRTDAEVETPVLWPPDGKNWLIWKDPDAGRDWGQEEKGTREDEMARWHHRLDGHEFGWTPGVGDGQGGLACCNSWSRKESDMTERMNWTEHSCRLVLTKLSPGGSVVKNLPAKQETWVWSLDWEDPLEKEMETHSSILAWEIPWKRNLAHYNLWSCKESNVT